MKNIGKDDKIAYAEVYYIIHNMNDTYLEKIPTKLVEFFNEARDQNYEVKIDSKLPLFKNDLKEYTYDILNVINLNYWATDLETKERLLKILKESENANKVQTHLDVSFYEKKLELERKNKEEQEKKKTEEISDDITNDKKTKGNDIFYKIFKFLKK